VLSECCKCHFKDPNFKNFSQSFRQWSFPSNTDLTIIYGCKRFNDSTYYVYSSVICTKFHTMLTWYDCFVAISNVGVECGWCYIITSHGLCVNYQKKIGDISRIRAKAWSLYTLLMNGLCLRRRASGRFRVVHTQTTADYRLLLYRVRKITACRLNGIWFAEVKIFHHMIL
jgi:hypothetical protein